ncbi:bifunctional WD40 repeat/WD40-repeat-containing domain superfamily/WD40-YVTN repeat-like-containing domain superfamily/Pre-mRNA-processing factor 17 [Babesia duncani]|uniref:Pre-mRNA-processing factor 17 n=1 Tax=Babesia duncani TaxID=323732 RepID=A0AAD9UP99_9APIC|nr:bifunctional WD40 repeat/WD40-repeat-containing domain superfamily/WD40-YVTN repeat-like-containing domain superfamily/Pre-mRNA-processing factor 17 [Babesia duncani]
MDILENYHSDSDNEFDAHVESRNLNILPPRPNLGLFDRNRAIQKVTSAFKSSHNYDEAACSNYPVDLLCDEDGEVLSSNDSSRIQQAYLNANLINANPATTSNENVSPDTHSELSVQIDSGPSPVLSIQIGSRKNASGILSVHEDDLELPIGGQNSSNSNEAVSNSLLKRCLTDRGFDVDALLCSNDSISQFNNGQTIESLPQIRKNGIYVTGSGQTLKTYYDDESFHELMRQGDAQIISENSEYIDHSKRRRMKELESDDIHGPWIPFEEFERVHPPLPEIDPALEQIQKPKAPRDNASGIKKSHESLAFARCSPEEAVSLNKVEINEGVSKTSFDNLVVSTLHKRVDGQYKNWTLPPRSFKPFDPNTYKALLPRREIHTYEGHSMAVTSIRYTPNVGHLLLSSSMDGFVKIWDSNNNRKCIRTYKGHCKGVRQVNFVADGCTHFYSCGCDSNIIQWDTEYGKVCGVYPIDQLPSCVTSHPTDPNVFIVGGANNKACQFDARTGNIELEYNAHMATVNTVTFIDNNRKIVTTGDDKKLLVWEYNIPVAIKHIAEQCMHCIPAVIRHPSDKFILGQSMNNQILVYEALGSRVKFFGKKRFRGHSSYGYSISPACSPDGKFVASGDTRGHLYFWDWKNCRMIETLEAHKSVLIDCQWHPTQPSRLATCSWDGTIKLWD